MHTCPGKYSEFELESHIGQLLAGPKWPQKEFIFGRITYEALYSMGASLRSSLGNGADGRPVCLCTKDKAVMAAALLSALAGGPALVIPYAFTPAVLDDLRPLTGFNTIVSDSPMQSPAGVRCIQPAAGTKHWSSLEPLAARTGNSEWVRLFTGGSTGAPRMWTKTVRNLLAETLSIVANYGVTAEDRLVATVSPNHIYGLLYTVLTPLVAGASVAPQTPSFPAEVESAVRDNNASILVSVPAHYHGLNGHSYTLGSLRLGLSSGGMLAANDAAAFTKQTGIGVSEIYGSTETGGIARRVRADGQNDFQPYDGIDIKIEADRLKVRSDYLSPELPLDKDGYFAVGDRVRAGVGNRFELLGRVDGIVKVSGRRVDLEAVRESLKRHPGITDALAISLPVGRGRENLVVAVVEGSPEAVDVNSLMLDDLESCARPRCIKLVEKIPVTPAGKYDRKTIEALFRSQGRNQGGNSPSGKDI
jgi:acyl-coenzyme A synthetase/AMP-(fatty) acid ligase